LERLLQFGPVNIVSKCFIFPVLKNGEPHHWQQIAHILGAVRTVEDLIQNHQERLVFVENHLMLLLLTPIYFLIVVEKYVGN
jgi:hypothetical protein